MFGQDLSNNFTRHRLTNNPVYLGTVADNNDPLKLQRVKIRIKELHRDIPLEHLPWYKKESLGGNGNNSNGTGEINVPSIGSRVLVKFLSDNPYDAVYGPGAATKNEQLNEPLLMDNYPHVYGFVDRSGNVHATDTSDDSITIYHVSGTIIKILGDGKIEVISASDLNVSVTGNVEIKAGGSMNLSAGEDINISGSNIHLNTSPALPPDAAVPRSRPVENYMDNPKI